MSEIFKYFESEIKIMSAVKRELVPIIIVKEIIEDFLSALALRSNIEEMKKLASDLIGEI
jgi:hypothetical protein